MQLFTSIGAASDFVTAFLVVFFGAFCITDADVSDGQIARNGYRVSVSQA